jgi:hypothetical protein
MFAHLEVRNMESLQVGNVNVCGHDQTVLADPLS